MTEQSGLGTSETGTGRTGQNSTGPTAVDGTGQTPSTPQNDDNGIYDAKKGAVVSLAVTQFGDDEILSH